MTLGELNESLKQVNQGLAYQMWKQAILNISMLGKDRPDTPEKASPELYPPKKTYQMPDWVRKKWLQKKGVDASGQ